MMDISFLKFSKVFPNSLIIIIKFKESHMNISLLDSLNEDENLITSVNTASESTNSADF